MSITSSIPVLQGDGGSVLSAHPGGLILERPHEEVTIFAEAIARVHAEGRRVAVEVRALPGVTPTVHRIEGVDEAAAVAFADAVNELLPEPAGEADGTEGVVVRGRDTVRNKRTLRRLALFSLASLALIIALAVVAGIHGDAGTAITVVFFGGIAALFMGCGGAIVLAWAGRRRKIKRGTEVIAVQTGPGWYRYKDHAGVNRSLYHSGGGVTLRVRYDPRDPADAVVPDAAVLRGLFCAFGVFIFLVGLGQIALTWSLVSDAIRGVAL
ncbi:hypothetical protein M5362_06470 [Streptomyces sp. Je 1-79]|uniref:hypothetical protein n=1 Tax=Streptomyces sp. Je 1-79 TaxID=2943847 RepID=UPI0021A612F7|nr:hypothetical protein [Streptomyces sp. Je 1-79]MCT4352773.1 hypothetical protein [Streptomyces sp. Je 1-79]